MTNFLNTNQLLGYPSDARLLIINADDFGMCQSINDAIAQAMTHGIVQSTTLMMPCPAASPAVQHLQAHPELSFGIHLTAIGESEAYTFDPLAPKAQVSSLLNEAGHFYGFDRMAEFFAKAKLVELELEFRTQIEAALAAQLKPTHLDWHSLRLGQRPEIIDLMRGLAKEYGLALRVMGQAAITHIQQLGLPCNDYDFLDSTSLPIADKPNHFLRHLQELPTGLNEWAVHPGLGNAELQQLQPTMWHIRQSDFDFLVSPEARAAILAEGIILLDYQPLQEVWRKR